MALSANLSAPPLFTAGNYSAVHLRQAFEDIAGPGVFTYDDFVVAFVSGQTVSVSLGEAMVRAIGVPDAGMYRLFHSGTPAIQINTSAPDATNPRVDQIVLRASDTDSGMGGASNIATVEFIPGTASAGADLDGNRSPSAKDLATVTGSKSVELIYDVLVPQTGGGAITIRDRRRPATKGTLPPIRTAQDIVFPDFGLHLVNNIAFTQADYNGKQGAALFYMPRRKTAVNKLRWHYFQQATALTGTYRFGLYDAMGRRIAQMGATAALTAGNNVSRTETLDTTFDMEPGYYWMMFGAAFTNAGQMNCMAISYDNAATPGRIPASPNMFLRSPSGGTTLPQTLLDTGTIIDSYVSNTNSMPVPSFSLHS